MNREQALKLIKILVAAFPQRTIEADTIRVYTMALLDLDYRLAEKAVMDVIGTNTFFPSIAEIRRMVVERELNIPPVEDAWVEVREYLSGYTPYDHQPHSWSHAAIGRAVEVVGWNALHYEDNRIAVAAQFRKAYEAIREREILNSQKQIALPEGKVRALQEGG